MAANNDLFRVGMSRHVRATARSLHAEFAGVFPLDAIERHLHLTWAELEARSTVNRFVPLLAERRAREQLRALACWQVPSDSPAVLFVSTDDPGRSRMAQALLRRSAGDAVTAVAASSAPGPDSMLVRTAMAEIGVALSDDGPLVYGDDLVGAVDVVVTLAGDACPIVAGHHYEDWSPTEPVDRTLDDVRRSRDLITAHVAGLIEVLGVPRVA